MTTNSMFGKTLSVCLMVSIVLTYNLPAFAIDFDAIFGTTPAADADAGAQDTPPTTPTAAPAPIFEEPTPRNDPEPTAPAHEPEPFSFAPEPEPPAPPPPPPPPPEPQIDLDALFGYEPPPEPVAPPPPPAERPAIIDFEAGASDFVPPPSRRADDGLIPIARDPAAPPEPARVETVEPGSDVRVVRHRRDGRSRFQNALLLDMRVEAMPTGEPNEISVTGTFRFRDPPTSFFYDINRRAGKLIFEFTDAAVEDTPIRANVQPPMLDILVEQMQLDANRDMRGLNPEWHDMIRVTFDIERIPKITVNNERGTITFNYLWTTDTDRAVVAQYVDKLRIPTIFWVIGGAILAVSLGALTWFLLSGEDEPYDPTLPDNDLPSRPNR